ncbi:MAG: FAD:protein FMN transferase [Verrucomicrobiota bacterium]
MKTPIDTLRASGHAALWWMALVLVCLGCRHPGATTSGGWQRFEFSEPHMGTLFTITFYAKQESVAREAARAAFARVGELNLILSDYDAESELVRLFESEHGKPVAVSAELFRVLTHAQALAEETDGAFDVTLGPLTRLWRKARRTKTLPDAAAIAEAKAAVGWQKLELDARLRAVTLRVPNMKLDLGGIAKGFAADEALAVLRRHGIKRALVAASGDLAIGDAPPGRDGWNVGIAPLDAASGKITDALVLKNCGVSTSGDTEQSIDINGVRYSHIVNPATGLGLTERIGVTVIARDATTTDALATAVSVVGAGRGMKLVEASKSAEAIIMTHNEVGRRAIVSEGFGKFRKAR